MQFETSLFIDLMTARTARDADAALERYETASGIKIVDAFVGDNGNNCGMIEVMTSSADALFERIMNGFDAGITYFQKKDLFKNTAIATPAEAMRLVNDHMAKSADSLIAVADPAPCDDEEEDFDDDPALNRIDPLVYLITTEGERTKTVTVADTTIGIAGDNFAATILSLAAQNKISNPLLCGRYNMGGSATFNFAERTIIASIPEANPTMVSFTVVYTIMQKDWKAPSYVYRTNGSGVFCCPVADIPAHLIRSPEKITKENLLPELYRVAYLPRHGTVIRHINYEMSSDLVKSHKFLRDAGFGIPLRIRIINGMAPLKRPLTHVRGLRYLLNKPNAACDKRYPVILHRGPIVTPFNMHGEGSISVEYWIMDVVIDPDAKQPARKPTDGRTNSKERGIFITLNGQTHSRLTTRVLLRRDFLAIDQHIIIEVNCDGLDPYQRGKFFASNRQNIKHGMEAEIEKIILNLLKADLNVRRINDEFAARLHSQVSPNQGVLVDHIQRLLANPLSGLMSSMFGVPQGAPLPGAGKHLMPVKTLSVVHSSGSSVNPATSLNEPDEPSYITVLGNVIWDHPDAQWIKLATDAPAKYSETMIMHLPQFLTEVEMAQTRMPFKHGHGNIQVKLAPETPVGTTGEIVAELVLGDGRSIRSAAQMVTVMAVKNTKPKARRRVSPKINPILVDPTSPDWMRIEPGEVPPEAVAFRFEYYESNGLLNVWINDKFDTYVRMKEEMIRKHGADAAARLANEYTLILSMMALPCIEQELNDQTGIMSDGTSQDTYHYIKAGIARGILGWRSIMIDKSIVMDEEPEVQMSLPLGMPMLGQVALAVQPGDPAPPLSPDEPSMPEAFKARLAASAADEQSLLWRII